MRAFLLAIEQAFFDSLTRKLTGCLAFVYLVQLAGLLAEKGRTEDAAAQLHLVAPEKLSQQLQSFYTQLSARLAAVKPSTAH